MLLSKKKFCPSCTTNSHITLKVGMWPFHHPYLRLLVWAFVVMWKKSASWWVRVYLHQKVSNVVPKLYIQWPSAETISWHRIMQQVTNNLIMYSTDHHISNTFLETFRVLFLKLSINSSQSHHHLLVHASTTETMGSTQKTRKFWENNKIHVHPGSQMALNTSGLRSQQSCAKFSVNLSKESLQRTKKTLA